MFCTILFVTYSQRFSRTGRIAEKIPGPKLVFLVGNVFEFSNNSGEFIHGLVKLTNNYGDVCRVWLGTSLYVVVAGLDDIEFFLSSNSILKKAHVYDFLTGWLGTGLITADGGSKWHAHRKMLTPAFHFKILEEFISVFNKNTNILVKNLKTEVGKPGFDVEPYISDYALDVICESAMGTPVNAQLDSQSEFAQAIKVVTTAVMDRSFKPWLFPKLFFDLSTTGRLHNHSLMYILDFVDKVIIKKKKAHEERKLRGDSNEEHNNEYGNRKRYAFLDLMLQYRDAGSATLSDMDIRDEVNTFMFAGHDTTTSAISFTMYALAKHPEVQEEAVKELEEIFGESDREETYQDLQNMKYLERVIKESMRLYTTVPFIGRHLVEDVTLPSGYFLPKGASVNLFLHKVFHNPKYFPNPEEFNPDNFLPEITYNRPPFAYCPFSAGPRNCIGMKFAMLEMKSTLSSILRKYRLLESESGPEVKISSELVLRSKTGMHIRIEKRT